MENAIITRAEAKAKGLTRYFTGKPCKYGHIKERMVSNGRCFTCLKEHGKKWRAKNKDKVAAWDKAHYLRNKEKRKQYMDAWREKNKEHVKEYSEKNRARYVAHCNERRTRRLKARPNWVNKSAMDSIYEKSRTVTSSTGVQHHVDHYYPLVHELVCGLDVPWNLQIITAEENTSKGNKMPEEFYGIGKQ